MKSLLNIIGSISLVLALNQIAQAKVWRGIVPLHSTRADVIRLLGNPSPGWDGLYIFKDERALILYSRHLCSEGAGWNVPQDTVTGISVHPQGKVKLSDFRVNLKEYEKVEGPYYSPAITSYFNEREGVRYSVYEPGGEIREIYYGPTAKDEHLRCPNLAAPVACIRPYHVCPRASIERRTAPCAGSVHKLDAGVMGVDPEDTFTINWTVSAGEITSGQGTWSITVDGSGANDKPITVTVKAISRLCEACQTEESYTIEPCGKGRSNKDDERGSGTPPEP